jgi:predicted CopG family antitoxin
MWMATKTLTIMDDVYDLLVRNKRVGESFSDVLRRVLSKKKSILEFAGAWADIDDEEAEEMKKNIKKLREDSTKELLRKYKKK